MLAAAPSGAMLAAAPSGAMGAMGASETIADFTTPMLPI
jgi:hypothetical protein